MKDIRNAKYGWPLWCPNCYKRDRNYPPSIWAARDNGLECVGCGFLQHWTTVNEDWEWLATQKKEQGSGFDAWIEKRFHANATPLAVERAAEWARLNDLALVRGFSVKRTGDPEDDPCWQYNVRRIDLNNPDKPGEVIAQTDSFGVQSFLRRNPILDDGYRRRPNVIAAQKRLNDLAFDIAAQDHLAAPLKSFPAQEANAQNASSAANEDTEAGGSCEHGAPPVTRRGLALGSAIKDKINAVKNRGLGDESVEDKIKAAKERYDANIDRYRRCRHAVVITINGEEEEIYCEDEGESNYKPPGYRFSPCKCGAMDVVVGHRKDEGMRCAKCGAPRWCPNCGEGGDWRLYDSSIRCDFCEADYKRQDPPPSSRPLPGRPPPSRPVREAEVQPYWTLLWDEATSSYRGKVVQAVSAAKALDEAIKQANAENEYGPDEDGGFRPLLAFNRADLDGLLDETA